MSGTLLSYVCNGSPTTAKLDIEKANKAGKTVFLVVTDQGIANTAKAESIALKAKKLHPKSVIVKMNRSEAANKELVAKYRLAGAPLPLILVIASNGIVTGGYPLRQATPELLIALIPTKKKGEVMLALNQGKSVFIVVSKKSMLKRKEVISKCEIACKEMNGKAKVVEIDLDDANEKKFLKELKVNQTTAQPQTYVINAQGQITGTLNGVVDSKTLVATAAKKPAGGCCPPGSKKSCAPKKK